MMLERSDRFKKQFKKLVKKDKNLIPQVEKTLHHLGNYPPPALSLRMKFVKGTRGIYECSVNMDIRITFEFIEKNVILLRNIDIHDEALKKP
ncbi:MAG: hypothetical protein K9L17_11820 [Clostridiales bacterium]|nr:hypothetical protein [Clostridiales bacterium]MCF8023370.1 hypothetical protein [Clostridiales bacterium]